MLEFVKPGQEITLTAADHNAFVAAARAHATGKGFGGGARALGTRSETRINITRETSGEFEPYNIVFLTGLKLKAEDNFSQFVNGPIYVATTPPSMGHVYQASLPRIAITLDYCPHNRVASAVAEGYVPCRVLWPIKGHYANPIAGDTVKMQTSHIGAHRVLWHSTKKSTDPTANATNGDTVWALLKLNEGSTGKVLMKAIEGWRKTPPPAATPGLFPSYDYFYSGFFYDPRRVARGWVKAKIDARSDDREFWVILPCDVMSDPNVTVDQRFEAELIDGIDLASAYCLAACKGHQDDRIGAVKILTYPTTTPGWALMNGAQDTAKTASGYARDVRDRAIYGSGSLYEEVDGEEISVSAGDLASKLAVNPPSHKHTYSPGKTTADIGTGEGPAYTVVTSVTGGDTSEVALSVAAVGGAADLSFGVPKPDRVTFFIYERVNNSIA